jgi:hypothetical protein
MPVKKNKVFRRKVTTALRLPTTINSPPEELHEYCSLIYGRKQWGKSTFASQYPNAITFMFEPGRYGLNILQIPKRGERALDWETFREYIKLFCEEDKLQVAIVDTVDRCYDHCFNYICSDLGIKHPNALKKDGPAVWDRIKMEFEEVFLEIKAAGKVFVLTSHEKSREQSDRDGATWYQACPSCKPAAWGIAQGMCDFVFHCDFLGGDRIVTVRDLENTTLASCNPEIECFLDPRGEPLRRFKIPADKGAVYASVEAAFKNKANDYDYTPAKKTALKPKLGLKKKKKKILSK